MSRFVSCFSFRLVGMGVLLLLFSMASWAQVPDTVEGEPPQYRFPFQDEQADVPFVATPREAVDSMLSMANVGEDDIVYDLGSGDGRIPIMAARQYGARGVGIEIKSDLVELARQNAKDVGVADRVHFRQGNFFDEEISEATVVTLYLLPSVNVELRSKLLRDLEPGTRVVSYDFHMEEWTPDETREYGDRLLYLWRIPEQLPDFVDEGEK